MNFLEWRTASTQMLILRESFVSGNDTSFMCMLILLVWSSGSGRALGLLLLEFLLVIAQQPTLVVGSPGTGTGYALP
ncbi:hypothetical protein KQX54_017420 [Cotesia glomerata]|uniref:Uncharacterized protein n=1 Tax=Cotesia glomerata TaxID=32391 RepID=A0AAV7I124_COTGL|nr:hypothetical protein KQX54_017420 [Cotesia glomerata]